MNGTSENLREMPRERRASGPWLSVGILCALAIALSIIGLARYSLMVSAVAAIILAVAFLIEGGSMARFFRTEHREIETPTERLEISSEIIGGAAGLVLGILALLNMIPVLLISIAALVYGAALTLGSALAPHLARPREAPYERTPVGIETLTGIAGLVLGILAVIGIRPLVLSLVAFIVLSFGAFLTENTIRNETSRSYVAK